MVKVSGRKITIKELEEALKIAANVVAQYGEVYLPIFSRVHFELDKAREEEKIKQLAFQVALQYAEAK